MNEIGLKIKTETEFLDTKLNNDRIFIYNINS